MAKLRKDGESAAELAEWLKRRNRGQAALDKISPSGEDDLTPFEDDKPGEFDRFGDPVQDRDRKKPHRPKPSRRR